MKAESRTLFEQVNELPMEERRKFAAQIVDKIKDEDARRAEAFVTETDSILEIVATAKYHREAMAKAPVIYTFSIPTQREFMSRENPYDAIPKEPVQKKHNSERAIRYIAIAAFALICAIAQFWV